MSNDPGSRHQPYRRPVAAAPSQNGQVIRLVPSYYWYFALLPSECDIVTTRATDPSGAVVGSVEFGPGGVGVDMRRRMDITRLPPAVEHEISIGVEQTRHAPRLRIKLETLGSAFADGDASAIARAVTLLPPDEE